MLNKILSLGGALLIAIAFLIPAVHAQAPQKKKEQNIYVPENVVRPWLTKKEAQKRIDAIVEWLNADFPTNIGENQAFIARKLTEEEKRELQRQKEVKKAAKKKLAKQKAKGNTPEANTPAEPEKAQEEEEDDVELTKKGRYVTLSSVGFLREYSPFARLFANAAAVADFEETMEVRSTYYREMDEKLKKLEDKIIVLNGVRSTGNVAEFKKALEKLKAEMHGIAGLASMPHERIKGEALAKLSKENAARRRNTYIKRKKKEMEQGINVKKGGK